ncbi:MAG: hypothetical protein KDK71_09460 [Chlamydiia bacterium]|nr:hypothetical protein [Chlamydiia bacterium]
MVLKISKLANPITAIVKSYAKKHNPLNGKYSVEDYKKTETDKLAFYQGIKDLYKAKREIVDVWESRLFTIGCLQGTVMLSIILIGTQNKELGKTFTKKQVIVIGPHLKITIGLFSLLETSRIVAKIILAYHKKHKDDIFARKQKFIDINQELFLENLKKV